MSAAMSTPTALLDLPVEVLEEICWQSNNMKLPLVCSALRDVIYSSQRFWSAIRLSRGQYTVDAHTFLGIRLKRAGTAPLDISILLLLPLQTRHVQLWSLLGRHKSRVRTLNILTDTMANASIILAETLDLKSSSAIPTLQTVTVRYQYSSSAESRAYGNILPQVQLRSVLSLANRLTTLVLPCVAYYVPYPPEPLCALETLILDTPLTSTERPSSLYQILFLLSRTPALKMLWCKTHDSSSMHVPNEQTSLQPEIPDDERTHLPLPVVLPSLQVLAVTIHGKIGQLLSSICAPLLHSLHLDGTFYLNSAPMVYPANLYPTLFKVSHYTPGLRRLAFIGASPSYEDNAAWAKILGCTETPPPFPLLESIALRKTVPGFIVPEPSYDDFNDNLLELYMRKGRVKLRRLALTGCGPCFSHDTLHRFIKTASKRLEPGQVFELEIDGQSETYEPVEISEFNEDPVKLVLHANRETVKDWWNMDHDIFRSEEYLF